MRLRAALWQVWMLLPMLAPPVLAQTGATERPPGLSPAQVARASAAPEPEPDAGPRAPGADDEAVQRAFAGVEVKLVRKSDGSFVYAGRGFSARIDAGGGLTIHDKFSRSRVVWDPKPLDEVNWVVHFFRTKFDLLARLDKAFGNDPFRSERREFLEQTSDLRLALLQRNAARALERALHAIWSAAGTSPQQKRDETFKLWAETSDDAYGQQVQSRVEQYVRERCPVGSACEYAPDELARLNARRGDKRKFAPYAPDAGVP